jgi:hypothetical protein
MSNNATPGAIKAKQGDNAVVLNRHLQFNQAMGAMGSKTKSNHSGTSLHNKWTAVPGEGTGGNVCGYSPGGMGCGKR